MEAGSEPQLVIPLRSSTPPEWAHRVLERPLDLLSDHAHCELRAAAAAQALIARNPSHTELVNRLSAVAIEEMRHFRRVVELLTDLGGTLGPKEANPYVEGLAARSGSSRGAVLLDRLLIAGLIEARSLERFRLLAEAGGPGAVGELYRALIPSEAAHGDLFPDLASRLFPAPLVAERAARLADLEAEVLAGAPFAPRVHSGLRPAPDSVSS